MESESGVKSCCPSGGPSGVIPANSKVYCKCGEGWSCLITKIQEGKPFYRCEENCCVCIIDDEAAGEEKKKVVEMEGAYCVCGEGYSCSISKTKGSDAGKVFCECGNGYGCEINDTHTTLKLSTA